MGAQDVWLETSDGVKIHGWRIGAGTDEEWMTLYFHGNAGNISHRIDHIEAITAAGSHLFIIDYRGYGKSEGSPSEEGIYRDADAAYRYVRDQGYGPAQIVMHGESLGTAVAVDLASRQPCAGVRPRSALPFGEFRRSVYFARDRPAGRARARNRRQDSQRAGARVHHSRR